MVRIFNIDGVFCGFTTSRLITYDDNGNTVQPCIIDKYYEGIEEYDRAKYSHSYNNRYQNHTTTYTEGLCVQDNFEGGEFEWLMYNCTDLGKLNYLIDDQWSQLDAEL